MALIFDRNVPAGVVDVARSTLGDLAAVPDSRGGRSPLARAVVSNTPLPVYSLRLDALARDAGPWDAGLSGAEPESWRMFVMDGSNEPTGVADVAPRPAGAGGARFLSYTRGPQVAASGQVLTDAEDAEPLRSREFQPRFLEIPGINVSAVWLKALDGQPDAVIPVDPIPRFLSDRRIYTLREFLELARPRAVQRLKFNNAPRGDELGVPPAQTRGRSPVAEQLKSDPFVSLPQFSDCTVRHHRHPDYVALRDQLGSLVPKRFQFKPYVGSASWLGSVRDTQSYLGGHRNRTIWKLCWYGAEKPMTFGVRRAFAVHFPELTGFSGWERIFQVPPHYHVDFVGFSVKNDEQSLEKIRHLIGSLNWAYDAQNG